MLMLGEAQGIVSLDTSRLDAGVNQAMGSLQRLDRAGGGIGGGLSRLDNQLQSVGMSTNQLGIGMIGLGTTMLAPIAAGVKGMMDLEAQMDAVASALGTTSDNIQPLTDMIMKIGADGQYSANQMAMVTEELAKAGYSLDAIMGSAADGSESMTKAISDLASATTSSLPVAVNAITTAMAAWSPDIVGDRKDYAGVEVALTDASKAADILTVAANASKASVEDIQGGMKNFAPTAAGFGITFQDTAAAVAMFANYGIPGREAGTSLTRALVALSKPTDEAAQLMQTLGINAFDTAGNFKGLPNLFDQLQNAMGGMSDEQRQFALSTIFGADALDVMSLAVQTGGKGLTDITTKMEDWGIASRQAAERVANLKGALQRMFEGILNLAMKMAAGVIAPLTWLANFIDKLVSVLSGIPAPILAAVGAITGLAGIVTVLGGAFLLLAPKVISAYQVITALAGTGGKLGLVATNIMRINSAAQRLLWTMLRLAPLFGIGYLAYSTNFLGFGDWIDEQVGKAANAWDRFMGIWGGGGSSKVVESLMPADVAINWTEGTGPDGKDWFVLGPDGEKLGDILSSKVLEDGTIEMVVEDEDGVVRTLRQSPDGQNQWVDTKKDIEKSLTPLERFNKGMDSMQEWTEKNGMGWFTPVLDGLQSSVNTGANWLASARGLGQWYDRFQNAFEGTRGIPGMDLMDRVMSAWNVSTQGMDNKWVTMGDGFLRQMEFLMDNGVNPLDAGLQSLASTFPALSGPIRVVRRAIAKGTQVWEDAKGGVTGFMDSWRQNYDMMGLMASDPTMQVSAPSMTGWQKFTSSLGETLRQRGFERLGQFVIDFGNVTQGAMDRVTAFGDGLRASWDFSSVLGQTGLLERATSALAGGLAAAGFEGASRWVVDLGVGLSRIVDTLQRAYRTGGISGVLGLVSFSGAWDIATTALDWVGAALSSVGQVAWDIILGKPTVLFGWGDTGEAGESGLDAMMEKVFGGSLAFALNAALDLIIDIIGKPVENTKNILIGMLAVGLGILTFTAGVAPMLVVASIIGLGLLGFAVFNAVKDYFKENPEVVAELRVKFGKVWAGLENLEHVGWVFEWARIGAGWAHGLITGLWGIRQALINLGGPFEWAVNRIERTLAAMGALNVLSKIGQGYFKGATRTAFTWGSAVSGLWELAKFPFRLIFRPMKTMRSLFSRIAVNDLGGLFATMADGQKITFGREGMVALKGYRSIFGRTLQYMASGLWAFIKGPFEVFGKVRMPFVGAFERFGVLWKKLSTEDIWWERKKITKSGTILGRTVETVAKNINDIKATKIGTFFAALNEQMRRSKSPVRFLAKGFTAIGKIGDAFWKNDNLVAKMLGPNFKPRMQAAKKAIIALENAPWTTLRGKMASIFRAPPVYGPFLPQPNQLRILSHRWNMLRGVVAGNLSRMAASAYASGNFMRSRVLGAFSYFIRGFQFRNGQLLNSMRQLNNILNPTYYGPRQVSRFGFLAQTLRNELKNAYRAIRGVGTNSRLAKFLQGPRGPIRQLLYSLNHPRMWTTIPGQFRSFAPRLTNVIAGQLNKISYTKLGNRLSRIIGRMTNVAIAPGVGRQSWIGRIVATPKVQTIVQPLARTLRTVRGRIGQMIASMFTPRIPLVASPKGYAAFDMLDDMFRGMFSKMPKITAPRWLGPMWDTFFLGLQRTLIPASRFWAVRLVRTMFFPLTNAFRMATLPLRAVSGIFRGLGGVISRYVVGPFNALTNAMRQVVPFFDEASRLGPRVAAGMAVAALATIVWKSNIFGVQDAYGGVFAAIGRGWGAVRKGFAEGGLGGAVKVMFDGIETALSDLPATTAAILESPAWEKTFTAAGLVAGIAMRGPMGLAIAFLGPAIGRMATRLVGAGSRIFRAWEQEGPTAAMTQLRIEMLNATYGAAEFIRNFGTGMQSFGTQLRRIPVIGDALGSVFERAGGAIADFGGEIGAAADTYRRLRSYGFTPLQAFGAAMGLHFPGVVKVWKDINDVWKDAKKRLRPLARAWGKVWDELKDIPGPLKEIGGAFDNLLRGDFAGFWREFSGGVRKLIPELGDVGSAIFDAGVVSMRGWRLASGKLFSYLGDRFPALRREFTQVGNGVGTVIDGVADLWQGMSRLFQGDVSGAMDEFRQGFGRIGEGIATAAQGIWDMLQRVDWASVWDTVSSTLQGWWNNVVAWFQGLPWDVIWNAIRTALSAIPWGEMWEGFKKGVDELFGWLRGLDWGAIQEELMALGGPFVMLGMVIGAVRWILDGFNSAIETFKGLWEKLKDIIPGNDEAFINAEGNVAKLRDTMKSLASAILLLSAAGFMIGFAFGGWKGAMKGLVWPILRLWGAATLLGPALGSLGRAASGLAKVAWGAIAAGLGKVKVPVGLPLKLGLFALALTGVYLAVDDWENYEDTAGNLHTWLDDVKVQLDNLASGEPVDWNALFGIDDFWKPEGFQYVIDGVQEIIDIFKSLNESIWDAAGAYLSWIGLSDPGHGGDIDPESNMTEEARDTSMDAAYDQWVKIGETKGEEAQDAFLRGLFRPVQGENGPELDTIWGNATTGEEAYQLAVKVIPELTREEWNAIMDGEEWDVDITPKVEPAAMSRMKRQMEATFKNLSPITASFLSTGPTAPATPKSTFEGKVGTPEVPQETKGLWGSTIADWVAQARATMPQLIQATQRPVQQLPQTFAQPVAQIGQVFGQAFSTVPTTATSAMGAASAGAVGASTGMRTGVMGNVSGISTGVTTEFGAARAGALGATTGMATGVIGTTAGMAGSAIGSAMSMGVGMTSGAMLGAAGTAGGMGLATGSVSANAGMWPGIIGGAAGAMHGAGFSAGLAAGLGVAAGLRAALGHVQLAAAAIIMTVNMAMAKAGEISSPSRLTEREIGRPLVEGIARGMMSHGGRRVLSHAAYNVIGRVDTGLKSAAQISSPSARFAWHGLMSTLGIAEGLDGARAAQAVTRSASHVMDILGRSLDPAATDIAWFEQNAQEWASRQNRGYYPKNNHRGAGSTTVIDQSTHKTEGAKTFHITSTDPEGIQREIVAILDAAWGDV